MRRKPTPPAIPARPLPERIRQLLGAGRFLREAGHADMAAEVDIETDRLRRALAAAQEDGLACALCGAPFDVVGSRQAPAGHLPGIATFFVCDPPCSPTAC